MFTFQSVHLRYGDFPALAQVDLEIEAGEQVCLIGPSGAGKSSLLGLMNGRIAASEGAVSVGGENFGELSGKGLREARSKIAWIPQDLGLVSNLRVHQNVSCGRAARKGTFGTLRSLLCMSTAEKEAISQLLERVGVSQKIFNRVDQLSGGQQQRVAIARALYQNPNLILADEPVSAVDPERARSLVSLLTGIAREEGVTLVMSLHDLTLAKEFFPRVIGLREGQIVFDGHPEELDSAELYRIEG